MRAESPALSVRPATGAWRSRRARSASAEHRREGGSCEAEANVVRAVVEHPASYFGQPLHAVDDREEVVAGERTSAAGECHLAVREQELGLADAARIPQKLPRSRRARRVLQSHAKLERAERDPAAFAAPSAVHEALRVGEQPPERGARRRRRRVFHPRDEAKVDSDGDREACGHRGEAMAASITRTDTAPAKTDLHSVSHLSSRASAVTGVNPRASAAPHVIPSERS